MPLSWNEIRHHAIAFSREWQGETRAAAERQSFWNDFYADHVDIQCQPDLLT
jgi:hypothetical protein